MFGVENHNKWNTMKSWQKLLGKERLFIFPQKWGIKSAKNRNFAKNHSNHIYVLTVFVSLCCPKTYLKAQAFYKLHVGMRPYSLPTSSCHHDSINICQPTEWLSRNASILSCTRAGWRRANCYNYTCLNKYISYDKHLVLLGIVTLHICQTQFMFLIFSWKCYLKSGFVQWRFQTSFYKSKSFFQYYFRDFPRQFSTIVESYLYFMFYKLNPRYA